MPFVLIIREQGAQPGVFLAKDTNARRIPSWAEDGMYWRHVGSDYISVAIVQCQRNNPVDGQACLVKVYVIVRKVTNRPLYAVPRQPPVFGSL